MSVSLAPADLRRVPISQMDRSFAHSGVYLLYELETVVYVGQSCNVLRRVGEHLSDRSKTFDAVAYVPCINDNRLWLERIYIERFRPRYNLEPRRTVKQARQSRRAA